MSLISKTNLIETYICCNQFAEYDDMFPRNKVIKGYFSRGFIVTLPYIGYEYDARLRLLIQSHEEAIRIEKELEKIGRSDVKLVIEKGFEPGTLYLLLHCKYFNDEERSNVENLIPLLE